MRELLTVGKRRGALGLIGLVVLVYVPTSSLSLLLLDLTGVDVPLVPGLVFSLGLLMGPAAVWGAAIGYLVVELSSHTFGVGSTVGYLATIVLVVSGYRLWGQFGSLSSGEQPGDRTKRNVREYLTLTVTVTPLVAAVSAWGSVGVGVSPFAAVVVESAADQFVSLLVVGMPLLYAGSPRIDRFLARHRITVSGTGSTGGTPTGVVVFLVATSWCVVGYGGSLLLQAVEIAPTDQLVHHLGREVALFLAFAGSYGTHVQVLAGLLFFAGCTAALYAADDED